MAYYTIAHLLQGNMFGEKMGPLEIPAEKMTPAVYDYIFCKGVGMGESDYVQAVPEDCGIPLEKLEKLRHEFEYWYPYDLRVSGKDLIKNHLMMSLYIHQAIWPDMSKMPRAYFCNGHIQLNNEKMSKSTATSSPSTTPSSSSAPTPRVSRALTPETVWTMPTSPSPPPTPPFSR